MSIGTSGVSDVETSGATVSNIMVSSVHTVMPTSSALEAAKLMSENNIRHLVITQGNGRPVGVLSNRDITVWLKYLSPQANSAGEQKPNPATEVQQLMSTEMTTVTPDTPITEAAGILAAKKIGCLLVIDTDKIALAGILTVIDVLRYVETASLNESEEEFEFYVPPRNARLSEHSQLVMPREFLDKGNFKGQVFAILGYSKNSKAIAIKFFSETRPGARQVSVEKEKMTIPAKDFRDHYHIKPRSMFLISENENTGCLVLTPNS